MSEYWIINLKTKEYIPITDNGDFFIGEWRERTPWPDAPYLHLDAQRVLPSQKFEEHAFYCYDLCRNGMLVGVYYDADLYNRDDIDAHIQKLRQNQDVVSVVVLPLKKRTMSNATNVDDDKMSVEDVLDAVVDIAASGAGNTAINESEYKSSRIKEVVAFLTAEEKVELFKRFEQAVDDDDTGWYVADVKFMRRLCIE